MDLTGGRNGGGGGLSDQLDADLEVMFQGARLPAETTINLSQGWNMLGYTRTILKMPKPHWRPF